MEYPHQCNFQKRHGLFLFTPRSSFTVHSKIYSFNAGSKILDIGTGGGFPGVPLAIMFPNVQFHLADSIGKKIKVINDVKEKLGLDNISTHCERVENLKLEVDFVVCRAVAPLETLGPLVG